VSVGRNSDQLGYSMIRRRRPRRRRWSWSLTVCIGINHSDQPARELAQLALVAVVGGTELLRISTSRFRDTAISISRFHDTVNLRKTAPADLSLHWQLGNFGEGHGVCIPYCIFICRFDVMKKVHRPKYGPK